MGQNTFKIIINKYSLVEALLLEIFQLLKLSKVKILENQNYTLMCQWKNYVIIINANR